MLMLDFEVLKNLSFLHHDGINHENYVFSAGSSIPTVENTRMPSILVLVIQIFQRVQTNLLRAYMLDRGFRRRCGFSQQVHFFLLNIIFRNTNMIFVLRIPIS